MYAKTFFDYYRFDSVTVAPYMGEDSVTPFLGFKDKWVILLALTSNPGAGDFQKSEIRNPESGIGKLFGEVLTISQRWGNADNMMYVIGATQADMFSEIRKIVPEHFFLVPGVGAQGGSLEEVSRHGMNSQCGLLVNSSRQVIYASGDEDFAEKAGAEAKKVQLEMKMYLETFMK
jgi:orotidine-5'-phosphate decarboxylase